MTKKFNNPFKKMNNPFKKKDNDVIVQRNWKKIAIWSSVAAVLVAAIIPAIYIPVKNHKKDIEPIPTNLRAVNVDEAVDKFNNSGNDEVWGLFIDIKDNEISDYANFGEKKLNEETDTEEFDKTKFNGPFGKHVAQTDVEWISFYDVTTTEATDMLAEFIYRAYGDDSKYGTAETSYFNIANMDNNFEFEGSRQQPDQNDIKVRKSDKKENPDDKDKTEDVYTIEDFGGDTSVDGPMWLTFKGKDLVYVVENITITSGDDQTSITTHEKFNELIRETKEVKSNAVMINDKK